MDLNINTDLFEKKIDPDNGNILFYRKGKKGIPDRVLEGEGFTVEIKDNQIYMIDIFNTEKVLGNLLKNISLEEPV